MNKLFTDKDKTNYFRCFGCLADLMTEPETIEKIYNEEKTYFREGVIYGLMDQMDNWQDCQDIFKPDDLSNDEL